jgi:hypothetical protein
MGNCVQEDVCNALDNGILLLPTRECVSESGVNGKDDFNIPKDLLNEIGASVFGDNVQRLQGCDPAL